MFGNGNSVHYKNPNIKTFFTPQGKLNIICFVFLQLFRLFIYYPKKLYKLIQNYKVFLKLGSIFISLSKILPVIGIAYKDKFLDTKNFLNDFGNPYKEIGIDKSGKIAIEWGVYGVPETFLINKKGEIIYRHAGPILYSDFKNEFLPILKKK